MNGSGLAGVKKKAQKKNDSEWTMALTMDR